jgi:hypothetical protein
MTGAEYPHSGVDSRLFHHSHMADVSLIESQTACIIHTHWQWFIASKHCLWDADPDDALERLVWILHFPMQTSWSRSRSDKLLNTVFTCSASAFDSECYESSLFSSFTYTMIAVPSDIGHAAVLLVLYEKYSPHIFPDFLSIYCVSYGFHSIVVLHIILFISQFTLVDKNFPSSSLS